MDVEPFVQFEIHSPRCFFFSFLKSVVWHLNMALLSARDSREIFAEIFRYEETLCDRCTEDSC